MVTTQDAADRAARELDDHSLLVIETDDDGVETPKLRREALDISADIIRRELGLDEIRDYLVARRWAVGGITHTHVGGNECPVCVEAGLLDRLLTKIGAAEVKP